MWDCIGCGCRAIAASLRFCPMCREDKDDMAKTTAGGGGTNGRRDAVVAAEPVVAEPPATPEPAEPVVPPAAAEPVQAVSEPPEVTGSGGIKLPPLGAAMGSGEDDADG